MGFCPDDWHQTTETDLQQMAAGSSDYEYAIWETSAFPLRTLRSRRLDELARKQKIVTDKAHAMAERLGLIPYSMETFERLMDEVECAHKDLNDGQD